MFKRILCLFMALLISISVFPEFLPEAQAASPYYVYVDIKNQIVTVYNSADNTVARQMICSTGASGSPTPTGTYTVHTRKSTDRKSWYYLAGSHCYIRWATRIVGGILFHSIPYNSKSESGMSKVGLSKIGTRASHGCVRLYLADSKWIALNVPDGTIVKIFGNGSLKPNLKKLLCYETYSPDSGLTYEQFCASSYISTIPGTLGRGASGQKVLALQQRLVSLGFLRGDVTGKYMNSTIAAVMHYQEALGMEQTGITTAELYDIIMTNDDITARDSTLYTGVSGPAVKKFQEVMKALGIYKGAADGVYSDEFAQSVLIFNNSMGISYSYIASPATQEAAFAQLNYLNDFFGEDGFDTLIIPTQSGKYTLYTIYWGHQIDKACVSDMTTMCFGDGVIALQERLRDLGFFNEPSSCLFNTATINALNAYQAAADKELTDYASVELQKRIFKYDNVTGTAVTLSSGMTSPAVSSMQQALINLGYLEGMPSGSFDEATVEAVKLFTKVNNIGETDIATPDIQNAIFAQREKCDALYGRGNYKVTYSGTPTEMVSAKKKVYLFKKMNTGSQVLSTLYKGHSAALLIKGGSWSKVVYGGKVGFIPNSYLNFYTHYDWTIDFVTPEPPEYGKIKVFIDKTDSAPVVNIETPASADPDFNGLIIEYEDIPADTDETVSEPEADISETGLVIEE